MKVLLVAQQGGHFQQLLRLRAAWEGMDVAWALTVAEVEPPAGLEGPRYFLASSDRRTPWKILANFPRAWRVLRRERPDVILSTGAAIAIPFALLGRLHGVPFVWVDSQANNRKLSGTGGFLARCAARAYTQWPALAAGRFRYRGRV
ncbi:MAG: hypothetical protein R3F30_02900 [Planctomycetota bacterium]